MDMVERVARAIADAEGEKDWTSDPEGLFPALARAAIAAMQESPTEEMVEEMWHDTPDEDTPRSYKPETEWECGDANCRATFVTTKGYHPARCPKCGGESFRALGEKQ